jgi:hypothetical protein
MGWWWSADGGGGGVVQVSIMFAQAIGLTALAFVIDQKEGLLDRIWVAGAKPVEVVVAHVGTQLIILLGQIAGVLFFTLVVFKLPQEGSLLLVILLMALLGSSGMACMCWGSGRVGPRSVFDACGRCLGGVDGLMISTLVSDEVGAIQMAMGTFFPVLLLSGILWPLEVRWRAWLKAVSG